MCALWHGGLGRIGAISAGGLLRLGLCLVSATIILPLFHVKSLFYLNYSDNNATNTYNHQVFIHLVYRNRSTPLMRQKEQSGFSIKYKHLLIWPQLKAKANL